MMIESLLLDRFLPSRDHEISVSSTRASSGSTKTSASPAPAARRQNPTDHPNALPGVPPGPVRRLLAALPGGRPHRSAQDAQRDQAAGRIDRRENRGPADRRTGADRDLIGCATAVMIRNLTACSCRCFRCPRSTANRHGGRRTADVARSTSDVRNGRATAEAWHCLGRRRPMSRCVSVESRDAAQTGTDRERKLAVPPGWKDRRP
jgi:hypothetical protein